MSTQPPPDVTYETNLLEQRYVKLRDEHNKVKKQFEELVNKEKSLEEKLLKKQDEFKQAREMNATLEQNALDKQRNFLRIQNELVSATQNLESIKLEKDLLSDRLKEREHGISEATSKLTAIQQQLFDVQAKHVPLEFERDKLLREKEALGVQNKWLDSELQTKADELRDLRTKHSTELAELQGELNQAKGETTTLKEQVSLLTEERDKSQNNLDKVQKEFHEYKVESNKSTSQYEALITSLKLEAIQTMQCKETSELLLKEKSDSIENMCLEMGRMEQDIQGKKEYLDKKMTSFQEIRDNQIAELEQELEKASQRLLEAEKTNAELTASKQPLALTANNDDASIVQSGGTLSEILGALYDKDAELRAEKTERQRMELHLDSVLKEIEKKAPILEAQRKDYKRALETYDALNEKLAQALKEQRQATVYAKDLEHRLKGSESELNTLRQQNADLSTQVQHLLQAQLDRSIGRPMHTPARHSSSSSSALSLTPVQDGHEVVSEHLITFENVADLQAKNLSLVSTVRSLTTELEKANAEDHNTKRNKRQYDDKMQALMNEVEEMRNARERQQKLVETIVSQRDMYRIAAMGHTSEQQQLTLTQSPHKEENSLQVVNQSNTAAQLNAQLEETLRGQISDLERSLGQAQSERDILKQAQEQYISDLKQKDERTSQSLIEAATATQLANYTKSRLDQAESELKSKSQECDTLRTLQTKAMDDLTTAETSIRDLRATNQRSEDNVSRLEDKVRSLENRQIIWEQTEKRLNEEAVRLRAEVKQMSILVESVQRIESGMVSSKVDEVAALTTEKQNLEASLETARRTVDDLELQMQQFRSAKEEEMKLARDKMDKLNDSLLKSQSALAEQQSIASASNAKIEALQSQIDTLTSREERRLAASSQQEVGDSGFYASQLDEFEAKEKQLVLDLEAAREEAAKCRAAELEWRGIASANEKSLKDAADSMAAQQAQARNDIQAVVDERDDLSEQLESLKSAMIELEKEKQTIQSDTDAQLSELQQKLTDALAANGALEAVQNTLNTQVTDLTAQVDVQRARADKVQANYERELQMHVEANNAARVAQDEAASANQEKAHLKSEIESLQAQLEDNKTNFEAERASLQASLEKADASSAEVEVRNKLLSAEVQHLGAQVDKLEQNRLEVAMGNEGSGATSVRSSDEMSRMRKILQSLQNEKGLLETRFKSTKQELELKEQSSNHLKRELEELRATLTSQRETASSLNNNEERSKLASLQEENSLLRESNTTLRDETRKLNERLSDAEDNVKKARGESEPLQKSLSEMTALRDASVKECLELKKSVEQWSKRVDALTDKYKVVDPEDYSKVKTELEKCRAELKDTREKHEQHNRELVASHTVQLSKLKEEMLQKEQKANTDNTSSTAKLTLAGKKITSLEQELKTSKEEVTKLQTSLSEAKTNLDVKEDRIEKIRRGARTKITAFEERVKTLETKLAASETVTKVVPVATPETAKTTIASPGTAAPAAATPAPATAPPATTKTTAVVPAPVDPVTAPATTDKPPTPKSPPKTTATSKTIKSTKQGTTPSAASTPKATEKSLAVTKLPATQAVQAKPTGTPAVGEKKAAELRTMLMSKKSQGVKTSGATSPPKPSSTTTLVAESKAPTDSATKSKLNPSATPFDHIPPSTEQEDAPAAKKPKAGAGKAQAKKSGVVNIGGAKPSGAKPSGAPAAKRLMTMTGVAPDFTAGKTVTLPVPASTPVKATTFGEMKPVETEKTNEIEARLAKRKERFGGDSEPASKKSSGNQ